MVDDSRDDEEPDNVWDDPAMPDPSERELPSEEELDEMFSRFRERRANRTPLQKAQKLVFDAREARSEEKAVELAREALSLSEDCAGAHLVLGDAASSLEEALEHYREAVAAGKRAIDDRMFEEEVGNFWALTSTRPYMRALAALADTLREAGQPEEAVEHYREMLRLNPNDNQGIRPLLMASLIELGRDEEAEELYQQYGDAGGAAWEYSRVLLDYRASGDSDEARKSLAVAVEQNPHVPDYLVGRKEMPRRLPPSYRPGEEDEAIHYVDAHRGAWRATPGALDWLAEQT